MTTEQAMDIINTVLKSHWPNWIFEDEETIFWIKLLQKYDFDKVKSAINNLYSSWEGQGHPPAGKIKKAIQIAVVRENNGEIEISTIYKIFKVGGEVYAKWEGKYGGMCFAGNVFQPDEDIEIQANVMLNKIKQRNPSNDYFIHRLWEGEEFRKKYRPEEFVNTENSQEQESPDNY